MASPKVCTLPSSFAAASSRMLTSRTVRVLPSSRLEGFRDFRSLSLEDRPFRTCGKDGAVRDVFQQPGGASLAYCGSQGSLDRLPGMNPVLGFECRPESLHEFAGRMAFLFSRKRI
jgi:hypothetical protein